MPHRANFAALVSLIHGENDSATQSKIVLQCQPGPVDLALVCGSGQLVRQFKALRETSGTERMPFRQQPARWIGNDSTTIGIVASINESGGFALAAETERLIGK